MKVYTKDIIAVLTLIGGYAMIINGFDGQVSIAMALIIGYYFSNRGEK